jgi:hypothetical protein
MKIYNYLNKIKFFFYKGLKELPESGDVLFGVNNESIGKFIAERRKIQKEEQQKRGETMQGELSPKIKFDSKKEKRIFYSGNKDYIKKKIEDVQSSLKDVIID